MRAVKLGPADIAQLSGLLDQALDLAPSEREAWFARTLRGEIAHLGPTLRELLARSASQETGGLMDRLPAFTLAGEAADAGTFKPGDSVGPYRLQRELGRGGMGEVWLAERSDGSLKRAVALKLPVLSARRSVLVQRFGRERDIVGSLAHPHIARLYDAGLTADGQPFLALEYVDGRPITEFCSSEGLGLNDRVVLVRQVMEAVQYAHANLVIHRDIKPSNVLVTGDRQAMLLDFGIAKLLLDDRSEAEETELTRLGGRALTLDYAAPEQISGAAVSIATDIWALGVLLYELLTGKRPFHGQRQQVERAILDDDPPALRGVPNDLAAIVLKALKKVPAERYATVNAFSDDLGRWLRGEPVRAQPDRAMYRLHKLIRRHRLPTALAAATLITLVVGAGVALWQARIAADQRDRALTLLSRNAAVNEFLDMLIVEAAQSQRPITVPELLQRSETLAEAAFRHAPDQQALVLSIIGMRHYVLLESSKAEGLLRRAQEAARDSRDVSFKVLLSCQHAASLMQLGRIDEARGVLSTAAYRPDLDAGTAASCLHLLAQLGIETNDGEMATRVMRQALERLKTSVVTSPATEASMMSSLASALSLTGRSNEAAEHYAQALATFVRLGREGSDEAQSIRNDWAAMLNDAGDARSALALFEANLSFVTKRGDQPPVYLLANRAALLDALGRYGDAREAFQVALAAAERDAAPSWVGLCLLGLAAAEFNVGAFDAALQVLERVERLDAAARPPGSLYEKVQLMLRGRVALARGDLPRARQAFTAAIADRPPLASTGIALARRAEVGLMEGQLDGALRDAEDAVALTRMIQGRQPHSWRTGLALLIQGRVLEQRGDSAAARTAWTAALEQLSSTTDPSHPAQRQVRELLSSTR